MIPIINTSSGIISAWRAVIAGFIARKLKSISAVALVGPRMV